MSSLYKVTEIEGKGVGCVAISEIKKGSLILIENPQLCIGTEERKGSLGWIKSLLISFDQMSKADKLEYMKLYNSNNNFKNFKNAVDIQNCKKIHDRHIKEIEGVKFEIGRIEQDREKAEEILKVCGIFFGNNFMNGVCIKVSRFNHSCQPNAGFFKRNGQNQLRAIGNIKAGEEINLNYRDELFAGFRNRKYRRQNLFEDWGFLCSCDLCKNDVDIDVEAFEAFIQEVEKLAIDCNLAIKAGIYRGAQYYSLENCRKEVMCWKQLYKVGKDQKVQPLGLFRMLDQGFYAATTGYQLYKATDLKIDAMNFAKTADKFGKILGNDIVTKGNSVSYKQKYQERIDKAGY